MNNGSERELDMTAQENTADNSAAADAAETPKPPEGEAHQAPACECDCAATPQEAQPEAADAGKSEGEGAAGCEAEGKKDEAKPGSGEMEEVRKLEGEIKRLSGELEKLRATLDDEKNRFVRLYAEYENYRKRTAAEKQAIYVDAYADVLKEILPVYDALERALNISAGTNDFEKMLEGIKMTFDMFGKAFEKMGIERFGAPGDKFDPSLHYAVMHEESDAHGEGEITEVFQPGFKKGDRVLRFAMVKVAN